MECFAAVARQRHHERSLVAKGHYRTSDVGGLEVLWAGRCHGLCGTLIFDLPHAGMFFFREYLTFKVESHFTFRFRLTPEPLSVCQWSIGTFLK